MKYVDKSAKYKQKLEEKLEIKLDQIAETIQKNAKSDCPVKTGALRDSIDINKGNLQRTIGSNKNYAYYQEMGTRKIAPKAFLRRALYSTVYKLFNF